MTADKPTRVILLYMLAEPAHMGSRDLVCSLFSQKYIITQGALHGAPPLVPLAALHMSF